MTYRSILAIAIFVFGFAACFAIAGFFLPAGNAAIPMSLVFSTIGVLSTTVGRVVEGQEQRLSALEKQLSDERVQDEQDT